MKKILMIAILIIFISSTSKADLIDDHEYDNWLTAESTSINIRAKPDISSDIVGVLSVGDIAIWQYNQNGWYYITSGDIEGYVSSDYTVTGEVAYAKIEENSYYKASTVDSSIKLRDAPSTDSEVTRLVGLGEVFESDQNLSTNEWVAIEYNGEINYISSQYVTVEHTYRVATDINYLYELKLLASIIYCEARGESYIGKVAVGAVVLNRVESDKYPNSIYEVIYQSGQFEPVSNGAMYRALSNESYTQECIYAAEDALRGYDPTDGCIYFCTIELVGYTGLVIGNHAFYSNYETKN